MTCSGGVYAAVAVAPAKHFMNDVEVAHLSTARKSRKYGSVEAFQAMQNHMRRRQESATAGGKKAAASRQRTREEDKAYERNTMGIR